VLKFPVFERKFNHPGDTDFMAEVFYGVFIVVMVVALLSSLMLKRADGSPQDGHSRFALSNILSFLRNHASGPEYTQQD